MATQLNRFILGMSNPRYYPALTAAPDRLYGCLFSLPLFAQRVLKTNQAISLVIWTVLDRLGIRGEVAARESGRTVDDRRRDSYLDSERVWRATPAVIP